MEEREVKCELATGAPALDPSSLFAELGRWRDDVVEQTATYFDTADLRLTRAGVSVRFRSDDGWTVKTPVAVDADGIVRHEHGFAGGSGRPPSEAVDLVLAWTRAAALEEVATVVTHRRRLRVIDAGETTVEVSDDTVAAWETRGGTPVRFREVEVELRSDDGRRALRTVVRRLTATGAARSPWPSKVAHALGARARRPADAPPAAPVPRDAGPAVLAQHAIAASVHRLVTHDHLVRVGDDPEGVHQARVATRRLRSDLRTFRPVLDAAWADDLRGELRWLGDALGRVRDADVLLGELAEQTVDLPERGRGHVEPLLVRLRKERARDRDTLLEALRSPRYLALLDRLVEAAHRPLVTDADTAHPRRRARALARRRWRHLRRTVRALPDEPTDAQLHEVRKRAKHARYSLEAIAPVTSRRAARLARRLARLQDVLGAQHDAIVETTWLQGAAAAAGDPDVGFTAGMLARTVLDEAAVARSGWRRSWRRVRRAARDVF